MNKPECPPKKPYTTPCLRCYGDLRRLTGGTTKSGREVAGSRTKQGGTG